MSRVTCHVSRVTDFLKRTAGMWTEPQTAGGIVSFLSSRPAYVCYFYFYFFYKKKKFCLDSVILIILKQFKHPFSIRKMHIKCVSVIFYMFLDIQVSFDQNQNES